MADKPIMALIAPYVTGCDSVQKDEIAFQASMALVDILGFAAGKRPLMTEDKIVGLLRWRIRNIADTLDGKPLTMLARKSA